MDAFFDGKIGIERESLRIDAAGRLSQKKNPFQGNAGITMDFCECQCELSTKPQNSPEDAMTQLYELTVIVQKKLTQLEIPEFLWPFSTPPAISGIEEIIPACFGGENDPKTLYRMHLAEVYGKYQMTFSGIHVNISLPGDLLLRDFSESQSENYLQFREQQYLRVTSGLYEYGWLITVLTAASPMVDASFLAGDLPNPISYDEFGKGNSVFTHNASVRCGKNGYWNNFVPVLCFDNYQNYLKSIQDYVDRRMLYKASELYLPIRLKLSEAMKWDGAEPEISHIEIRNVDLNPYELTGLNILDLKFIHMLTLWIYGQYRGKLDNNRQLWCNENFKVAAVYNIESAKIITADSTENTVIGEGLEILDRMEQYFSKNVKPDLDDIRQVITFQRNKLRYPQKRYAATIRDDFGNDYFAKGIQQAKIIQKLTLKSAEKISKDNN